jgi:uncharacterized membrane protein YfcA
MTSGQILAGQNHKNAIGVTTFAEAPICIAGFFTYIIGRSIKVFDGNIFDMRFSEFLKLSFSKNIFNWELVLALLIGSMMVAPFGALTTQKINTDKMHIILGTLVTVLGATTLYKVFF